MTKKVQGADKRFAERHGEYQSRYNLSGFDVLGDQQAVDQRLNYLRVAFGAGKFVQIRLDFDTTLSTRDSLHTFEASAGSLRGKLAEDSQSDRARNLDLQRRGLLSKEALNDWTSKELGYHALNGTWSSPAELEKEAPKIRLRQGVESLFELIRHTPQIVPLVVSGGHAEMIEAVFEHYKIPISAEYIISNRHTVSKSYPSLSGIPLIGDENKRLYADSSLVTPHVEKYCAVGFGDSLTDAAMADDFCIRTCQDGGNTPEYLAESAAAGFHLVLVEEDITPVVTLLSDLVASV